MAIAKQTPSLGVGVHLNLVQGRPASDCVPSLVQKQGNLLRKWGLIRRYLIGKLSLDDVKREVEAQIRRVIDSGITPTHIDSHQHLHVFPPFAKPIADVADSMRIPAVRVPIDRYRWSDLSAAGLGVIRSTAVNLAARVSQRSLKSSRLVTTEWFSGTLMTGSISADWLQQWVARLPSGVTELMAHPGLANDKDLESRLQSREVELNALIHPGVVRAIQESSVRLIHYGQLANLIGVKSTD